MAGSFEYMPDSHKHMQTDHTPTMTQRTHKDKHTTWSAQPGDMLELKFTGVSSSYLSLISFFRLKTPSYYASYFYPRALTPIILHGK